MQVPAKILFTPGKKYSIGSRMWHGVPAIEKTGDRLWAAWFSGGKYEPCIHNYAIVAYSDDCGETWIEPYFVVAADETKGMRVMDAQLWVEPGGDCGATGHRMYTPRDVPNRILTQMGTFCLMPFSVMSKPSGFIPITLKRTCRYGQNPYT